MAGLRYARACVAAGLGGAQVRRMATHRGNRQSDRNLDASGSSARDQRRRVRLAVRKPPDARDRQACHRIPGGHSLSRARLFRPDGHGILVPGLLRLRLAAQCPGGWRRPFHRRHPCHLYRLRRSAGRRPAQLCGSFGGPRSRALADHPPGDVTSRGTRYRGEHCAWSWPRIWRNHDRSHGFWQRRYSLCQSGRIGAHAIGNHRRRIGRGRLRWPALHGSVCPGRAALHCHVRHQFRGRSDHLAHEASHGSVLVSTSLKPRRWPRLGDVLLWLTTGAATVIVLILLVIIVGDVVRNGARGLTLTFLTQAPKDGMTAGGIFPAIFGTVALVLLMTLAALPAGVATAIYLHEYARPDALGTRIVRVAVNNLAGVPSIVFGLFGLGFFVQFLGGGIDKVFYGGAKVFGQPALLWAALTMAVLTLPVVIVATEEALSNVSGDVRLASAALGATQFQTITRVVLPQAVPGILTGAILAVSRGAGEVAPILFTGAAYFLPKLPHSLHDQFMQLGYHVYVLATQSPDVDATRPLLYSTVLVLLILTFALNASAIVVRSRM